MPATISIRPPAPREAFAVRRLAYLDSQRPLRGDVLVAFEDDDAVAAISLADTRVVADPFRRTAETVKMLKLRAAVSGHGDRGLARPRLPLRARLGLAA